ncbi:MAG: V-type ATP synthase subunit I [Methanobacteriota archaeon]
MFYPARMDRIIIGVHKSWRDDLISSLQCMGEVEIIDIRLSSFDCSTLPSSSLNLSTLDQITHTAFQLDQIIESGIPFMYKPPSGLKNLFETPDDTRLPASDSNLASILSHANHLIDSSKEFLTAIDRLKELNEEKNKIAHIIENLNELEPIITDTRDLGSSRFVFLIVGKAHGVAKEIEQSVYEVSPDEILLKSYQIGSDTLLLCIGMRVYFEHIEEIFKSYGVIPILLPEEYRGKPIEQLSHERKRLDQIRISINELIIAIQRQVQEIMPSLYASQEELSIRRGRQDILKKARSTRDMFLLEGWVRHKDLRRLEVLLEKISHGEYLLSSRPAIGDDDPPVLYDNPFWLKPFEILTTTFARPRYNEVDPTPFFAPLFLFFFGMMLGDAGYGIIIALAGFLIFKTMGRDPMYRDMAVILLCAGVVDIICGTIQGGWFGDLPARFLGFSPPFVLIDPLKSPIILFQIALIIGTIHINLGILIAFWENIRIQAYKNAFQEQVIWFILQPAAALLLARFFGWITLSANQLLIAELAAGVCLVVLFYSKGPMGFFSLTGFLGDWLSYVRILALALATGGIAMTINLLTEMIASASPYLIIPAILFCILGQTFNLAIQTLGSVIHALRLHYIEFFGKFYTGGGRAFHPFQEDRIYTMVTREET